MPNGHAVFLWNFFMEIAGAAAGAGPAGCSGSALRSEGALLLEARPARLGGEAALARSRAWPGRPAQRRRGGGAADQRDEARQRVRPVALLRAKALRGDDQDAVLRHAVAAEPLQPCPH